MTDNAREILSAVHAQLQYRERMGERYLPVAEQTMERRGGGRDMVTASTAATLEDVRSELGDCTRCGLCKERNNIVFGVGNPKARLMFVGEGPGADEDRKGEPFVGRAGQLLDKIIEAMKLKRADVYINNIVMCRPPQNRAPTPEEAMTCIPYLHKRIAAIQPEIIVCLGSVATRYLLEDDKIKITKVRGIFQDWNGYKVMPTYHPAYLLRNPNMKRPVWDDMQKVMALLK